MNKYMKRTENGDVSFKTTGNNLLDILFMTAYFEKHLDEINEKTIGRTDKDKLFAMFVRDPRFGLGRRDLGRKLFNETAVDVENIVKSGRFDDVLYMLSCENAEYLKKQVLAGDELAKKWMPRLNSKNKKIALEFCKAWGVTQKEYRKMIKCNSTVEFKLSFAEKLKNPLVKEIDFEHIPSLAMIKYFDTFMSRPDISERFRKYLESVKKGEKELKISTTTVYDIFKNRDKIDADLFFDKIEKIEINCLPILDTSGSMWDANDSIGKAVSIAHYLAKCSTYCKDTVMSFSNNPRLIEIKEENYASRTGYYGRYNNKMWGNKTKYQRELNSMYTGDAPRNTDFRKVIEACSRINVLPEYFVVLSDMEFDEGSYQSKEDLQKLWEEKGISTKIVWWNFNTRNTTVPEIDKMGNIYLSGYNPQLLKFLEAGFDGNRFLDKLLEEYSKSLNF